jgi:hypothetical protein
MSVFTTAELLDLSPSDLYGLMALAPGDNPVVQAAYLGLDCSVTEHRDAVDAALAYGDDGGQAFSPPVGAGQPGVRSYLTPAEPDPAPPVDAQDEPDSEALGLPESDPEAAEGMAAMLAATAGSGVPFLAGTFALYSHPSGSVVMVTETSASGVRRDVIPRKMVKLALGLMGGGKRSLLGKMLGG